MDTLTKRVVIVGGSLILLYGVTALAQWLTPVLAPAVSGAIGYGIGVVVHKYWRAAR